MAYVIDRTLFLHVPKTGGKAVLSSFYRAGVIPRPVRSPGHHVGHASSQDVRDGRYQWDFVWGMVRHPLDWYRSLWKFAETPDSSLFKIDPMIVHPFRSILPLIEKRLPLSEFTSRIIHRRPGFYSEMLDHYFGHDLELVDFVGRQEELVLSMKRAIFRGGIKVSEKRLRYIEEPLVVNSSSFEGEPSLSLWKPRVVRQVERFEDRALMRFYRGGEYTGEGGRARCRDS